MTRQLINTGIIPNDGQGDSLRDAGGKMNNNFQELYTALGNGTALTIVNNNLITATGANKITFLYYIIYYSNENSRSSLFDSFHTYLSEQ